MLSVQYEFSTVVVITENRRRSKMLSGAHSAAKIPPGSNLPTSLHL